MRAPLTRAAAAAAMIAMLMLVALPAGASALCYRVDSSAHAVCLPSGKKPKEMVLDIQASGSFAFTHTDSGVQPNASCANATDTGPFSDSSSLQLKFQAGWEEIKVPFGPLRVRKVLGLSGSLQFEGTYNFSGSGTDSNCDPYNWPAGGGGCSGEFSFTYNEHTGDSASSSELFENLIAPGGNSSAGQVPIEFTPVEALQPAVSPAGCNDSEGQFHSFQNEFAGIETPYEELNLDVDPGHGVGAYSFARGHETAKIKPPPDFQSNCSDPSSQYVCSQSWSPPGSGTATASISIQRVGIVK